MLPEQRATQTTQLSVTPRKVELEALAAALGA
jgi:hypothetical protein